MSYKVIFQLLLDLGYNLHLKLRPCPERHDSEGGFGIKELLFALIGENASVTWR